MDEYQSLSHTRWECKYHVVFIPKCRRKTLYGELRRHLGEVFRKLAVQKESKIEEGHLMPDHVHMMISIPPKYAVSQVIGFIKGKSAIHLLASMARGNAILWDSTSGRGDLRLDDRARRSRHQGVHPEARAGGPAPRSDESVALTSHRQVAPTLRGRVSGPTAASSGHITQGPRLCRGIATRG